MAEKEGADGVSVITPYFIKPSQSEIGDHYRRIAESTKLPVVLYNNPRHLRRAGHRTRHRRTARGDAEHCRHQGQLGDLQNTIEILRNTSRDKFCVLNGRDTLILAALQAGVQGEVPASCNIAPELAVGLYESFMKGDLTAAKEFQARLHPVRMAMTLGTGNGAVKEALHPDRPLVRAESLAHRSACRRQEAKAHGHPRKSRPLAVTHHRRYSLSGRNRSSSHGSPRM